MVALAAKHHDIPFYVAAPYSTFDNEISIMETIIYNIERLIKNELKPNEMYIGRISENEPKMKRSNSDRGNNLQI